MRRALRQAQPGFDPVEVYPDLPQQKMLEAIESFFQNRHPDDQIVFLFCGYLIQDSDQSLYFATPETQADKQGRLIKARAIPARFVQDVMNSSPAKQQIMILDCYIRQNFTGQSTAADESPINLQTYLGGEGRVILASSARTRHYNEPEELDVWSYTRYLADGVETAAADDNSNGFITVDEWHNYARRKLGTAAPAMQPELFGSMETARQFFLPVPVESPPVAYRKMLEEMVGRGEVDVTGSTILTQRTLLDDIRYNLELSPQEAAAIEAQALRPVQDYRQRLQTYQEKSSGITQKEGVANPQIRQYLNQIQAILGLTDTDTAAIDAAPRMAEQQKQRDQYQDRLAKYQQVLLITMQRQFPLAEGDRQVLQRLQQVLQIRDEDAAAAETQLMEQISRQSAFVPQDATQIGQTAESPPPAQTTMSVNPGVMEGAFPRGGFTNFTPTPASGAPQSDRIRNISFNPNETSPPREVAAVPNEPQPRADIGVAQDTPVPPSPQAPMNPSPRGSAEARVTETRVSRSYSALIIPGILLAALIGSLVALWSSKNLPNPFGGQNTPTPSTGTNALSGAKSAAANIGYGIEAYGAGLTDKAITYATDAINLLSKNCPSGGQATPQSNDCLYLARAYSNRSNAYFAQQDYGRALSDANRALALDSNLPEARINLANAKFRQGDLSGAETEYNKVLNLRGINSNIRAGVYNNLGSIKLSQKNFNDAINQFNQAIKLKPNYADAYYNRAIAQDALGQTTKAINDFRSAAQYYRNQGVASLSQAEQAEKQAAALQQKSPSPAPSKAPQSSPASAPQSVPASTDTTPKG